MVTRGSYNELLTYPNFVSALLRELETSGSFSRGIEKYNSKGTRGEAINVDVYGYEEAQRLAVIQVRQCLWRKNRYNKVRKDYYLCGYNESNTVFAHPINSPARSSRAMYSPEACVQWAECQIFDCTEKQLTKIVRQGDVAFVPAAIPTHAEPVPIERFVIDHEGSHLLRADNALLAGATLYVRGAGSLIHLKGQHAPVSVPAGSWRVQLGYRAEVWGFSAPTRD